MKMQSLWLLIKKNIKLLLRAKGSALIVFIAPLLIILVLGLSYNTSAQYGLNIGVYAPSFSDDVNVFMNSLQQREFKVVKYEGALDDCIGDIKIGAIHTCISLPESFTVEGNTPKEVTFYIDPSRINLVWMIQETVKSEFNLRAQELSQELAQDLLGKVQQVKTNLNERVTTVNAVIERTSAASSSAQAAQGSLSGLDLSVSESIYDASILTTFQTNIGAELAVSQDKVNEAKDTLGSANVSAAVRSTINNLLDDAAASLTAAQGLVSGTGAGSVSELSALITALNNEVTSTRDKLNAASAAVGSSNTNLAAVSAALSESSSSLEWLRNGLSEAVATLEGQKVTEASTLTQPLRTKVEKVTKDSTYLNYTFSTLLVLVVMFTSLLLGTIMVMMEKNSPAFVRNYFLPVKKVTFILSIYLTNLLLILVQILVILLISLFFLQEIVGSLGSIFVVLFIAASVFTFMGMAIGYAFRSEETGVLASISLGSLLLFISGVVLPIETISPSLREITALNPFVISEKLIREVFIFGSSLREVWIDLLMLIGYAVLLFLVVLIIESVLHQHLFSKLTALRRKELVKASGKTEF